jgi:hypothetical protein
LLELLCEGRRRCIVGTLRREAFYNPNPERCNLYVTPSRHSGEFGGGQRGLKGDVRLSDTDVSRT